MKGILTIFLQSEVKFGENQVNCKNWGNTLKQDILMPCN